MEASTASKKRIIFATALIFFICLRSIPLFSQAYSSQSAVNWATKNLILALNLTFLKQDSSILDRGSAVDALSSRLPSLIKEPLLSIIVDSSRSLGDLILLDELRFEVLTEITKTAQKSAGVFINNGKIWKCTILLT